MAIPTLASDMKKITYSQAGASLIEVLVAILLLSFGMLALGSMLSFAVQAPKLSLLRTTAANLAASHVERIRANPVGFANDRYTMALSGSTWSFTDIALADCAFADPCTEATLATMDIAASRSTVRRSLPAGDMVMWCNTPPATTASACTKASQGNLWVIWQEPSTVSLLSSSSDDCPPSLTSGYYGTMPARCLYIRFKVE